MDETQISITIKPLYIERLVYWIVIIALAVLLILAWNKSCSDDKTATGSGTKDTAAAPAATPPAATPPAATPPAATPPATASCSDATKNQDETDVDCGGVTCSKCMADKSCKANTDCVSGYCSAAGKCGTPPPAGTMTGKVELKINDASIQTAPAKLPDNTSYTRVKLLGVSYKITNGLAEDLSGMIVKVYVKNKAGTFCLNQQTSGTCDQPYATFSLSRLASGKSLDEEHTFSDDEYTTKMGKFLISDNGYDPADPTKTQFNVVVFLYDQNGDQIGGKSISYMYLKSP